MLALALKRYQEMLDRVPTWVRDYGRILAWPFAIRRLVLIVVAGMLVAFAACGFAHGFAAGASALAAIGTVAVASIALLRDWLLTVLFPLRLRLEFDPQLLTVTAEVSRGPDGETVTNAGWWLGLRVHSRPRWRAAKRCRVMLVDMHTILPDGDLRRRGMTVACPLAWGVLDQEPSAGLIQVTVGSEPEVVNLLRLGPPPSAKQASGGRGTLRIPALPADREGLPPHVLHLTLANWTLNFPITIRPGDRVQVALQIRADDFIPRRHWVYEISWDGQMPDRAAEFWEHVHVRQVT